MGDVGGVGGVEQVAVEGVVAVLADGDFQRRRGFLFGRGLRQHDLQLREARERRGGGQEDQDHQQDIDEGDQVDLELILAGAAAAEVHGRASRERAGAT
ncbi:Uncharacterised protein [Bordetella pertussis]|nr:Uncharacterised protein [Bordetella pertussis]